MANKHFLKKLTGPILYILLGALARLIPHAPNFTPVGAIALFGGYSLNKKQAYIIPLLIMFISDIFIGFDSFEMRIFVYLSFLITVTLGRYLKEKLTYKNMVIASFASSIVFFIITNFAVWLFTPLYLKDLNGLINCYIMAIPFFRNTIIGDLFYSGLIFGLYQLANLKNSSKVAYSNG